MKFARRNSLTFPLKSPSVKLKEYDPLNDDLNDDPFDAGSDDNDCIRNRPIGKPPLTGGIEKALKILNDDSQTMSLTSHSSHSDSTNSNGEEILRVKHVRNGFNAISTPLPGRKPLQLPSAKRKEIALMGIEESPTSVADLVSLSLCEQNDENAKSLSSTVRSDRPPPIPEDAPSRDSSTKSARRNRKPMKKVHFKQTCTMRRTLSRKDMTPKEIRKTWLSAEEYNRMQLRDEILADRIDVGKGKPGTCTRGLESKIEATALRKVSLRMTGIEEILVEQERQWDEAGDAVHFFYDFPAFAYVYGPVSEEALIHAQEVANVDRKEAEKILQSPGMFKAKGAAGFLKRYGSQGEDRGHERKKSA
eukprot:CAMPEP_0197189894 /NCGR_PEP_ID=MMETSP1423-20130617/20604_1 /TAXON_ID=476441 /ORGANISM="Pseudo-nitzschia heimii, Strain UNC1101" /LENGTH=361 /DNA_ID=CAMNT_0042642139 /DNA_START=309 /DNA_END=1391 /DNA_ORIENTATION=-